MGSELHAGSLAMHWVLVLNFKWFPRYASMNLSYFRGNSNGLGYSNPSEDQPSLPCAAANTLVLPCAQGRGAPLASRTDPTKPCILTRPQPTVFASQIFLELRSKAMGRSQMMSEWEMHRKTPRRLQTVSMALETHSGRGRTSHKTRPQLQQLCLGRFDLTT